MRVPAIVIFCLLFNSNGIAQTTISGFVKNEVGNKVPYATVNFKLDSAKPAKKYCIASDQGKYELICSTNWTSGYLEVSAIGYITKRILIKEIKGHEINIDVLLTTSSVPLQEVIIKIEPPISVIKDTISFKTDFFKRGNEENVAQLLKNIPGFIAQDNGRIIFNGKPISKLLIEGDDLTGRNYEDLANNLAIDGIDKIQVIDNYSDPDKVISKLSRSNEQVLNIKFKNKFLGTLFGSMEAFAGNPLNKNEFKGQTVFLKKNSKIVSINGYNSLGNVNAASNSFSDVATSDLSTPEISFKDIGSFAEIEDIVSAFTDQKLIYSNRSSLSSTNYNLRFSKKLSLKGTLKYLNDDYFQTISILNQIFTFPQPITIYQEQHIEKDNRIWSIANTINYLIDNRNQILFLTSSQNKKYTHLGVGKLYNDSYEQKINGKNDSYGFKTSFTHLFKNNGALFCTIELQKENVPALFTLTPPNYDSFFYKKAYYQNIVQDELQDLTSFTGNISLLKKYYRDVTTISVNAKRDYFKFQNAIKAYNSIDELFNVRRDSINNSSFPQTDLSLKLVNEHKFSLKSNLSLQAELLYTTYDGLNENFKRIFFLPTFTYNIQLSKLNRLAFLYSTTNFYPEIKNIADGYTLTALTSITEGSTIIHTGTATTFQGSFSHIDFLDKGFLFFSNFSYLNRPLLYLPDVFPGQRYTLSKYVVTDKQMNMISFYSGANKFYSDMKYKLSTHLVISRGTSFGILKSLESRIQFYQLNFGTDFKFQTKKIEISSNMKFDLNTQKIFNQQFETTTTKQITNTESLNWKLNPNLFFDASFQTDLNITQDKKRVYYFLANTAITKSSKNARWRFGLKINNLLNRGSYSYTSVRPYQTYFSEYQVFPRVILAFVKFKF